MGGGKRNREQVERGNLFFNGFCHQVGGGSGEKAGVFKDGGIVAGKVKLGGAVYTPKGGAGRVAEKLPPACSITGRNSFWASTNIRCCGCCEGTAVENSWVGGSTRENGGISN